MSLVAACGEAQDSAAAHREALQETGTNTLACAPAGGDDFVHECWFEFAPGEGEQIVIVHRPDGGFQRFALVDDGLGIVAADGAIPAEVRELDELIEVRLGGTAYLVPPGFKADASE